MLTRLTSTADQKAAQNPATCIPGSIHATSATMPALITSRNNPRVMMVIGKVSTMAMGRTMELTTPEQDAGENQGGRAVDVHAGHPHGREPQAERDQGCANQKTEHGASISTDAVARRRSGQ